jgi:hypothetical protein
LTGELTEENNYTTPGECRDGFTIESLHMKESVELQDLILLTDFFGIPDLQRMVEEATISPAEIEFQMINKIQTDKTSSEVIENRIFQDPLKSFEFKYNPITLTFILVLMKSFGLNQFKID